MLERPQHPNIVRIYAFEQDDLLAFIVIDYIPGSSLRTEIFRSRGQPLPLVRILDVLRLTCSALQYAYCSGIAHCDVKPANIWLEQGGGVLLSDFGIARTTENATAMTRVSLGSPAYMAPEKIRGERPFTGERRRISSFML